MYGVKMKTKAQGLPINVIILLVIGLAVLVVLTVMFTQSSSIFSKTALTCESKGGKCVAEKACQYEETYFKCPKKDEPVCCINPLGGDINE